MKMNVSERALLVQLSVSQWTARKYDKKVTQDVAKQHGAITEVGRYNKVLLPMNDSLDNVHKKTTLIRKKYYDNTLPWGIEGTQMLPASNYFNFMAEFKREKNEWELLVKRFLFDYPRLKQDAQRLLPNGLFNDSDYPSESEIANKFKMDMVVMPVPSNDFRVAISDSELARIQQDVEARVKTAQADAMKDLWKRLYERVENMADKLADPKAVFRDTLVENARELCALLPKLNFAEDGNLELVRQEVETRLSKHHPDALRNNPDLRRDTAQEARMIMDRMATFMGSN